LVDAKWEALRQNYTGAMSDMTLQWLQANGATSDQISDAWMEVLLSYLPVVPELITNPQLAGGAASSPGNENPPTGWLLGFLSTNCAPEDAGDGYFAWRMNPEEANGRGYLYIELGSLVEDNKRYRVEVDVTNIGQAAAGTCLAMTGQANITITDSLVTCPVGIRRICYFEFETGVGATGQFRVGAGVTTTSTAAWIVQRPRLFDLDAAGERDIIGKQRNDLWYDLLGSWGYDGQLNDREFAFWSDGGVFTALGSEGPAELEAFLLGEGWAVTRTGEQFSVVQGVHEWRFTWSEAEAGVYAEVLPAPLLSDIDDFFGR